MQSPSVLRRTSIPTVGLALALSTTVLLSACGGADAKSTPPAAATPVLVRAVTHLDRADYVALSGEAEAFRTANVGFLVPGLVRTVNFKEGDAVDAGQVLAELDPTDYQLNVDLASAQLDRATDEFTRAKSMFDKNGIPADDFNKAEIAVRMARTQASMARKKLGDTHLASPLTGIVARRGIEPGEQTGPGAPAFTVMQVDPVQIRIGVPESEIARLVVGQRVDVRIPSLNDASFSGVVRLIGIAADPASRTYTVKAEVPNSAHRLRPGMIAEVRIENGRKVPALTIPPEAVVRDVDGVTQVFVYDAKEQRVRRQRVEVGAAYGTEIEIRSGLKADDLVVTGGQHRVRDGSRVTASVDSASRGRGGAGRSR